MSIITTVKFTCAECRHEWKKGWHGAPQNIDKECPKCKCKVLGIETTEEEIKKPEIFSDEWLDTVDGGVFIGSGWGKAFRDVLMRHEEEIKELRAMVERQEMLLERYFKTGKVDMREP